MALTTSGSTLSALARAPAIPGNVGKIDAASIYNQVVQGLQTAEALRQAAGAQRQVNAENQAAVEAAPMRTAILAQQAEQAPIQTALLADKAALSGATLPSSILAENATNTGTVAQTPSRTAILAAQASPEYLAAQRQHLLASSIPQEYREFEMLTQGLTPEQKEAARRIKFGIDARQSGAAIQYKEVVGADGVTRLVAVDPRQVGAQVVGTGERYGGGIGAPLAQPAPVAVAPAVAATPAAIVAPTPNVFASAPAAERKAAEATATETAKLQAERQSKLPKAQQSLTTLQDKTKLIDQTIDEAKALVGPFTVGYGSMLDRLPATDARALKAKIDTIRANIGFDALQEMRQNSPTGGALGAVSDYEGQNLQGTLAKLDTGLDATSFLDNLERVRAARNQTLARIANAYQQDFKLATEGGKPAAPGVAAAANPSAPTEAAVSTQAQYDALPSGAEFVTPSGARRRKP